MPRINDLTGRKFGKLTVLAYFKSDKNGRALWNCRCECGNYATVSTSALVSNNTHSCGCSRLKHNMFSTRPYSIWRGMKTRCNNPKAINFDKYGGRGIKYEGKWEHFEGFWEDMSDGYADNLTLDRGDGSKGYSKDNCKWKPYCDQNNNRNINVLLEYQGVKITVQELGNLSNTPTSTVYQRLRKGWTVEEFMQSKIKIETSK